MKPITNAVVGFCLIVSGLGCQCYGLTERYADFVDDVSDHKPNLDRFYSAKYDLNRIGKPDWYESRINCWLCGRTCCEAATCRYCQTEPESNPNHELSPPPAPASNPTPEQPELNQPNPKPSPPEQPSPKPNSTQEEDRPKSPDESSSLQYLPPILLESEADSKNVNRRN